MKKICDKLRYKRKYFISLEMVNLFSFFIYSAQKVTDAMCKQHIQNTILFWHLFSHFLSSTAPESFILTGEIIAFGVFLVKENIWWFHPYHLNDYYVTLPCNTHGKPNKMLRFNYILRFARWDFVAFFFNHSK